MTLVEKHQQQIGFQKRLNNRGSSLIEAVVAMAIISIIIVVMAQVLISMESTMQRILSKNYNEKVAVNLINSIRNNPKVFQAHFKNYPENVKEAMLKKERMPLAWDRDGIYEVDQCLKCPGRAGFIIEPIATTPGLLKLTLRVYEIETDSLNSHRDYHMIFGAR
ncbi:MAG: prepilin-type N-terminal cleavage/methylation domain-containing protein [Bdellovibrionales bacterium]|nr:prepilin-type N-terminal cleavage/methylation domain-containing protein [Bdellovibrionales bacterium]